MEDINMKEKIKGIYNNIYKLNNISFYKCHDLLDEIFYDNSILFTKSINDSKDLSNLLIEKNNKKVKIIIAKEINENINQSNLIKFIINSSIPLYKIDNNIYHIFINFFAEGKNVNYINLDDIIINNINKNNSDVNNFIDIYQVNQLINEGKSNNMAIEEKDENNINKIYNELMNETENIYKILNIKLIKRLIYEILSLDYITISEVKGIFDNMKNIVNIFKTLCMEYYFNISQKISNYLLKENLHNYILKLSFGQKEIEEKDREWLTCLIDEFKIINKRNYSLKYKDYIVYYKITNMYNENHLLNEVFNLYDNIKCDLLLFISKSFNFFRNKENIIEIFINSINIVLENIMLEPDRNITKGSQNYGVIDKSYFSSLFLSKIINILYDYYIDENTIIKKNNLFDYFTSNQKNNNFEVLTTKYIDLNIYFDNINKLENLFTQKISFLIQFAFRFFDFYLISFLKKNEKNLFEYWLNSKNQLFKFYCDYKILSIDNNYK